MLLTGEKLNNLFYTGKEFSDEEVFYFKENECPQLLSEKSLARLDL